MPKFKCTNTDCKLFDKESFESRATFVFDERLKEMRVKSPPKCENCHMEMEYIKEKHEGDICINVLKFNSLTSNEKKAAMKKRYQDHSKNDVKERVHEVRKSILGENYKLLPKGQ